MLVLDITDDKGAGGKATNSSDWPVHTILQTEDIPAGITGRDIQKTHIQSAQDVSIIKLSICGPDGSL